MNENSTMKDKTPTKVRDLKQDEVIVTVDEAGFERAYLVDHVGVEKVSVTLVAGRGAGTSEWTTVLQEQQITLDDSSGTWWSKAPNTVGRLVRAVVSSVRESRAYAVARLDERDAAQAELASLRAAIKAPTLGPVKEQPPAQATASIAQDVAIVGLYEDRTIEHGQVMGHCYHARISSMGGSPVSIEISAEMYAALRGAPPRGSLRLVTTSNKPLSPPLDAEYDADSTLPLGWHWDNVRWPVTPTVSLAMLTAVGPEGEMVALSPSGRWLKIGISDRHDKVWANLERALLPKAKMAAEPQTL